MLKNGLVVFSATCLFSVAGLAHQHAWWVTWSFRPTGTEVEGVPVRTLNRDWHRASAISPLDLPAPAKQAGERPEDYGLSFSIDADLDGDSLDERAVVGVYETRRGEIGRFLLILGRLKGAKSWRKKALFSLKDPAPFSAVESECGTLRWHGCLECDDVCDVIRSGAGFQLRCYSP